MSRDSEEVAAAKDAIDAAIRLYVKLKTKQNGNFPEDEDLYVMAWAAHAEYISKDLIESGGTRSMVIAPNDQLVATSIGIFQLGMAAFNIKGVL